jgi:hypothetical protein
VHSDFALSPWIDPKHVAERALIIALDAALVSNESRNDLKRRFPTAEFQPPLFVSRRTVVPRRPVKIEWAIVPPQP